ncbi:MAG: vWA domain-containing protein [Solirubrobacterales bacterium]
MSDSDAVLRLIEFGRALRSEGLPVGSGQLVAYAEGLSKLDPTDLGDVYWAGRASLLSRRSEIPTYDRVFRQFFQGEEPNERASSQTKDAPEPPPESPEAEINQQQQQEGGDPDDEEQIGAMASSVEALRHKPFPSCTAEELAALRELIAALQLDPPRRASRRTQPHSRGRRPDVRRSIRRSLRTGGEMVEPRWRRRRERQRRLVLLLDVSGSMAEYSRALLQFAYSAARGSDVETFCFATRLSRFTDVLERRDPDAALAHASRLVVDWDGGTRIGDALAEFTREWGRRGLARGSIVVICSDGLERGDPELLAPEMERLARLAYRVIWVNPLKGDPAYEPLARGMRAALPYVDIFLPGHDLASLEALATLLPALQERGRRPAPAPRPPVPAPS